MRQFLSDLNDLCAVLVFVATAALIIAGALALAMGYNIPWI